MSLDAAAPPSSWQWAGPEWLHAVRMDVVSEITAVELQTDDPLALAQRWSQVLNRPVAQTAGGVVRIVLDQGASRFVQASDGRGAGISGIDLAVIDRPRVMAAARDRGIPATEDHITICGTRIRLV